MRYEDLTNAQLVQLAIKEVADFLLTRDFRNLSDREQQFLGSIVEQYWAFDENRRSN
jgi:hypothetical protein